MSRRKRTFAVDYHGESIDQTLVCDEVLEEARRVGMDAMLVAATEIAELREALREMEVKVLSERVIADQWEHNAKMQSQRADEAESEVARLRNALATARDCLADMHDDTGCKFTSSDAEGCMACFAFEEIAKAEELE